MPDTGGMWSCGARLWSVGSRGARLSLLAFSWWGGLVSCGGKPATSVVLPPRAPAPKLSSPEAESERREEEPSRFERLAPLDWSPARLSRAPIAQTLASSELGRVRVELSSASPEAWLALDHHAPRALSKNKKSRSLTELLNEDEEIAPGEHHVLFVAREGESFTYELQSFQVDTSARELSAPACFLFSPRGTFNGDAEADALQVIVFPLVESVTRIHVRLEGEGWSGEIDAEPKVPLRALELPSGDFSVQVRCLDASGRELANLERIITVNRDAPVKETTP